jgi:serine/threonine-protein kinase
MSANGPSLVGQLIGNYTLERLIGRGGMGEVYQARHVHIGHRVAVKVLLPQVSRDQEVVQRFFNEARASTMIKHPGVVHIFDVGWAASGGAYIVMELLGGESMRAYLQRVKRLAPADALALAAQAASAVGAAHAAGIVHRDLKPENLFLVQEGGGTRVKVLDFGIAKLAAPGGGVTSGLTHTGAVMGTPTYMAPEQWKDAGRVDHRADVYSLGCVLFELLAGGPPFPQTTFGELVAAHIGAPPPDVSRVAQVPPALAALVLRTLAKEPGERPQSMTALAAELEAVARGLAAAAPAAAGQLAFERTAMAEPAVVQVPPMAMAPVAAAPNTTLGRSVGEVLVGQARPRSRVGLFAGLAAGAVAAGLAVAAVNVLGGQKSAHSVGVVRPAVAPPDAGTPPAASPQATNPWVIIEPHAWTLGVDADAPDDVPGFRPARRVATPSEAFAIQQHEVTWAELDPYLDQHPDVRSRLAPLGWSPDAKLPATGVPWDAARDYCKSIGGALPSEAQWELAARGPDRKPNPWGDAPVDPVSTVAYAKAPAPAGSSEQDVSATGVRDLAGNAQEWTADLWREDHAGLDETWVSEGGMTFRALRGLPLGVDAPTRWPTVTGAFRQPLCATGPCPPSTVKVLQYVGFRCVKPVGAR